MFQHALSVIRPNGPICSSLLYCLCICTRILSCEVFHGNEKHTVVSSGCINFLRSEEGQQQLGLRDATSTCYWLTCRTVHSDSIYCKGACQHTQEKAPVIFIPPHPLHVSLSSGPLPLLEKEKERDRWLLCKHMAGCVLGLLGSGDRPPSIMDFYGLLIYWFISCPVSWTDS